MNERMSHPQKIGLRPAEFFHQVAKKWTPAHLLEQIYFLTTPLPTRANIFFVTSHNQTQFFGQRHYIRDTSYNNLFGAWPEFYPLILEPIYFSTFPHSNPIFSPGVLN